MRDGTRTSDYDFALPAERIAQEPSPERDQSRLMMLDRATGATTHQHFRDLVALIPRGDALVMNTTRVLAARLLGTRDNGAAAEVLMLEPRDGGTWEAMVHPGGKLRPGKRVTITPGIAVVIDSITAERTRLVHIEGAEDVLDVLAAHGHVPLPPYIARHDGEFDRTRYQTVYAREDGSVAAPTAGLHFTEAMLGELDARGVARVGVTLHVGAGTFRPVSADDPAEHTMHAERFEVSERAARLLNETRTHGGRIWAVGTTSLRVLETVVNATGAYEPGTGRTSIFIRPGHVVRGADRLITNFHLPRSTLLMLVAAFAGYERTMHAYAEAIREGYRFYSYGDAMCII